MHVEFDAPVQPQKTLKTLTRENSTHRLIRRKRVQTSVQPTITKNPARAELGFSSPRSLKNLTIWWSNQVQRSSNFGEMKMMTSRTHPQNISMKVLTDWEESEEIGARAGFSLERKNFVSKELVNPGHFELSRDRWIHHKELREELRSRASWSHKRKPKFVTDKAQDVRNWYEVKTPEGTRREGPPFPFNLSTRTQKSILLILP